MTQEEYNDNLEKIEEQFGKLQVGDILTCRWGYSMILWDFFQVLKKTKKTVTIQRLQKTEEPTDIWLQVKVKPIKNTFARDSAVTRRVNKYGDFHGTYDSQCLSVFNIYDKDASYIEDHAD